MITPSVISHSVHCTLSLTRVCVCLYLCVCARVCVLYMRTLSHVYIYICVCECVTMHTPTYIWCVYRCVYILYVETFY
uniref:Uncharacterized protein n=1 Tax=Anguilla anguilla TaxID=7936 RepID=A0A0E9WRQ7_ANGAN